MTKNLNSFLLTISALFCLSTANAQSFPDTAWTRCYGGSLIDEGLYIQQTFDGGYIVLGKSASVDGDLLNAPAGNKNWILKLDSLGNIEWQQYLNVNQFTGVKNVQQTTDGGYLVGGQKLTKLLPDGSIDWELSIHCQSAIETYDGGYALLFDQNKITKLTANLIQEWTNDYFYGIIETSYYGLSELVQTTDSGYAFCGRWSGFPRPYVHGGWLRKVDKNGSHVLSKEWGDYSYVGFTESMDGEFVVTGSLEDVPG